MKEVGHISAPDDNVDREYESCLRTLHKKKKTQKILNRFGRLNKNKWGKIVERSMLTKEQGELSRRRVQLPPL